ncbi:dihydroxyacetone kinase subunit DhaL [Nocardia sp. NBC_01503]|uniref:dihydroxyacetone kinase subunit DhaL n=1 Tax=Nocardia sp. NBC_01503 TaxID=2975997 RepID=UPI002E7C0F01|nr:dihydroxyacetone kinase subunit DhaL [Nocardia sp. NBC_01503]WTL34863.1 dihydroxyacetone kinase subunit DhaL [Nocardia sp. NBC_01503]
MRVDAASWIREFAALVDAHAEELTALDAAIGDADHGTNMRRGLTAAVAALDDSTPATPAELYKQMAMVLIRTIGGASGPLYGTFFLRFGTAIDNGSDTTDFARALRSGLEGVIARGKAEPGDKTMVDALAPAADALDKQVAAGASATEALDAAVAAAESGRDATIPLIARKGRASYLGERSAGHQDPGATSAALLLRAARAALR